MPEKLKFKPTITKIKLDPEQAVLFCLCYTANAYSTAARLTPTFAYCLEGPPKTNTNLMCRESAGTAGS